jgi:hypothetical protein
MMMASTTDTMAVLEGVRRGDPVALATWADLLEERGEDEGAAAVRLLPRLAEEVARNRPGPLPPYVIDGKQYDRGLVPLLVSPDGPWEDGGSPVSWAYLDTLNDDGRPELREEMLRPAPDVGNTLCEVFSTWNDLHPGVEWLARRLGYGTVELWFEQFIPARPRVLYRLDEGDRLHPLPESAVVTKIIFHQHGHWTPTDTTILHEDDEF